MAATSNCSPVPGGPFRATRIWNTLVLHLQENANVKRRRNVKKYYDECFTGTNAVDVLYHFVRLHPEQFSNSSTISRDNIVRLCQSFLDNGIFEQVGTTNDSDKPVKFDDSTSSLYNFTNKSRVDANTKSLGGRQVLKEIDGEIRNSLGHISISSEKQSKHESSTTPKSKNILIPTRKQGNRSRFPSFGGISAQSFKESFRHTVHGSESEEETTDTRAGRRLKRTSSLVGAVVKRSSSDSNLCRDVSSTSSSSDNNEHGETKEKKSSDMGRGGKLRLSQRLSFRKKSISSNSSVELLVAKMLEADNITSLPPAPRNLLNLPTKIDVNSHPIMTSQSANCFDPRRRSVAVKSECTKPRRSLRRMISSPTLMARRLHRTGHYDVTQQENIPPTPRPMDMNNNARARILSTPTSRRIQSTHEIGGSPPKMMKKDAIKETPSRFRSSKPSSYLSSLANFAHRVSVKRKSLRRSEQSTLNIAQSCVIKNPQAANGKPDDQVNKEDNINQRKLTTQEVSHLRRECVRVRLLQILDLPFVDSLITSPTFDKKNPNGADLDDVFSGSCSSYGVQYSEVVTAYNSEDSWIAAALSVLQHLPNGYEILCKHARDSHHMKKIKLFFAISDYYKSLSKPLIDESMSDIVDAIVQMLATKPVSDSLEALQLFLHLLPDSRLFELRDLFTFLHCVTKNAEVALTPQCNNKTLVLQIFPLAIFPCSGKCDYIDTDSNTAGLAMFVMERRHQAFKLPPAIAATMKRKRKLIEAGEVESPSLVADSTFCAMISSKEYNKQRVEFTRNQVSELARYIATDQSVPPRKKKDFLKKLQSSHPSAYERSRGPLKVTHQATTAMEAPQLAPRQPVIRTPSSDPLTRRKNKSRKQVYV